MCKKRSKLLSNSQQLWFIRSFHYMYYIIICIKGIYKEIYIEKYNPSLKSYQNLPMELIFISINQQNHGVESNDKLAELLRSRINRIRCRTKPLAGSVCCWHLCEAYCGNCLPKVWFPSKSPCKTRKVLTLITRL